MEDDRGRTRRVRFSCYQEEVIPVDFLSWRVLEHLLRDRNQREHYGAFFKLAFRFWKLSKEQALREQPFVDLALRQAEIDPGDEDERARCERLLRWWKIKVKEHRTLSDDEPKALRMLVQALRTGRDEGDDPEHGLTAGR